MVPDRRKLSLKEQIRVVFPFSALGALNLGLGNWGLLFIYPSLNTILQNTTPIWAVIMSVLINGQRFSLPVYLSMIPVCVGGMMCVAGEKGISDKTKEASMIYVGVALS